MTTASPAGSNSGNATPFNSYGGAPSTSSSLPVASTSTGHAAGEDVELTHEMMGSFKPSRIFRNNVEPGRSFTACSFDDRGDWLVTSAEDETMQLFNCRTGKHYKQFFSKKYGVDLARFTHTNTTVIHASTKGGDVIRYMSLHDNNYIRYFKGHTSRVNSLEMGPVDDTFLSAAEDDSVKLWDLRSENVQGSLTVPGRPSASYDPNGAVFAVCFSTKTSIQLYDVRQYDKAPFIGVTIEDPILYQTGQAHRIPIPTSCRFSNDGKLILLGTAGNVHYILDSFQCTIKARLEGHVGLERMGAPFTEGVTPPRAGASGEELSWTPDGRYVISGSLDGTVCVWDVDPPATDSEAWAGRPPAGPECTLRPIQVFEGHKGKPSRVVRFNPRMAMMCTAGAPELAFWLPEPPSNAMVM